MERSYVKSISKSGKIFLEGWVHELRDLAKIKFILLRDASGIVQCVIKNNSKSWDIFSDLSLESVISIEGSVNTANVKSEDVDIKNFEVEIDKLEILNKAETLPIQVKEKDIETGLSKRLDYRYLDIRKKEVKAIFNIQNVAVNAFREFFFKSGFIEIQPPAIIATSTEGGTELFKAKYFDKDAYLAQSPQLYKQLAAISWEKVFSTSTIWRAEKHNTPRHLNEVRQLDIEVGFANDMDVMKWQEEVMKYIIAKVIEQCKEEIKILNLKLKVPKSKYLTYKEAVEVCKKNGIKIKQGDDFEAEAERKLCEIYKDSLVFVHSWPQNLKPFYIWPREDGNTGGFDMLYGGMELSSGGQRIHKPDVLINELKKRKLDPKKFSWYVDAFRYGAPMHAGWSIGLERLTMVICSLDNIREATLFPRDRDRLTP